MDALITLIMLGAFILSAVQKSERQKEKQPTRQSVPNQRRQPDRPVQRGDILSRAKENVRENESDTIQQEVHAQVCREYRDMDHKISDVEVHKMQSVNCDTAEESDMMKKVNDLMVTGYSGELNFDRDFIAEGIEMLNRFSL